MPPPILAAVPRAGALATLRPGDGVDGVFVCTRKERLAARTGAPYLALELRDRSGALPARLFRDADLQGGRFEAGELVRVSGRVVRFREQTQIELARIERADDAKIDPTEFLPVAYRDLDELDGFLEHLAREVADPATGGCWTGCWGIAGSASSSAPPPAREPGTTHTSAACSSTPSPSRRSRRSSRSGIRGWTATC